MCPGEGGWKDCALMPHWGVPGFLTEHISSVRRLDAFFGLDHLELKHPSCLPGHDGMQRQTSGNHRQACIPNLSSFLSILPLHNFRARHIQMQFFRVSSGVDIYAQNVCLRVQQFGVPSGRAPALAGCLCSDRPPSTDTSSGERDTTAVCERSSTVNISLAVSCPPCQRWGLRG